MTVRERARRAATPWRILLAGWIGCLLYAYPGFLTTEAADELVDSRVGEFTDWHSPVLTEIWRWLGQLVSGPAPMLAVQSAVFLAGAYHLLRRALPDRAAAIAAIATLLFPPVLATTAVICPDAMLTAFLAAGAAAIASPRRPVQVVGLGLLLLACGLREGASLAALPILLAGFTWRTEWPAWQRRLIAAGVWLLLVAGAVGLQHLLVDSTTGRRELALATRDLTGTLRFAGRVSDAELASAFADVPLVPPADRMHDARRWYVHPEELTDGPHRLFDPPTSADARDRIVAARGRLMRAHPAAYLRHRWRVLAQVIGLTSPEAAPPVYTQFIEIPDQRANLQLNARYSVIQRQLVHAMRALGPTLVFRPYLYLLVALLALPLAIMRRQPDAAMLLGSAIAAELALMFVTITAEARASQWMIAATILAVILVIARGRRSPALAA